MDEQKQEEGENQSQEEEGEAKPKSELEERDPLIGVKSIEDGNVTAQTSKIDESEESCPNNSNNFDIKGEIGEDGGEIPNSTLDENGMRTKEVLFSKNNEENSVDSEENKMMTESAFEDNSKQELLLVPTSDNKTEFTSVNAQTSSFIRKQLFFIKKIIPAGPRVFPLKSLPKDSVPCTVPLKTIKKDTITCMLPLKTLSKESVSHAVSSKTVLKDPKARSFRLRTLGKDSVVCAVLPNMPSKDPSGVSPKNSSSDSIQSEESPKKSLKDSVANATLPKTLLKDSVQSSVPSKSTAKDSGSSKSEDQGGAGSSVKRKLEKSTNNGVTVSSDSSNLAALVEPLIKRRRNLKTDGNPQDVDRYCWMCHRDGIVIPCATCPRVYHLRCVQLEDSPSGDWVCPECITILNAENVETRSRAMRQLSLDQLCNLLKYALHRMKAYPGTEPFCKPVDQILFPRYREFIAHPMDLSQLERNIRRRMYGSTEAFIADTKWILHDCIIFNTHHTKLSSTAKSILKICKQEMSEIEICPDCYLNAHTRKDSWFIEVCRKPHVLLWAKLKGFPFWPAKVMRTNRENMVDVRFFGAHDRAWVPVRDCFLYSIAIPATARNKKKHNLEACVLEVEQHIQKLKERFGGFEYAAFRIPFDPSKEEEHLALFLPGYKGERSVSHLPFQQRFRPRILRKSSEKPPPVDAQTRLGGFRVSTVHSEAAGFNQSGEEEVDEEASADEEPGKEEEQRSSSASASPMGRGRPLRVYSRRHRSPSPSHVQEVSPKGEPEEDEEEEEVVVVVKTEPEEPEPPKIGSASLSDWARFEMEAARITMSQQCSNASDMDADELISEELVSTESCNVGLVDIVDIKEEPLPELSPPQSPECSENLASEDITVKEPSLCDNDPTDMSNELKGEPVDKSSFSSQPPCELVNKLPIKEERKSEGSCTEKVDRPVSGESDMESLNITEDDTSSLSSASETAEREIWARMTEVDEDESKEEPVMREKTSLSDSLIVNEPTTSEENTKPLPEPEISDTTSRKRPREVDADDEDDQFVHTASKECKLSSEETHPSPSSSSVTTPVTVEQNSGIIEKLEDSNITPNKKVGLLPALIRRLHGSQPRVYLSRMSGGRSTKAPAGGSCDLDDRDNESVNISGAENENVSTSTNYANVGSPAGGDSNSRSSLSSTSSSESRGSNTSNSSSSSTSSSNSSSNSCSTKSSTSSSVSSSSSSSSSTSSSGIIPDASNTCQVIEKNLEVKENVSPESLRKLESEMEKIVDDQVDSVPDKTGEETIKNDNSLILPLKEKEVFTDSDKNEVSEKTDSSEVKLEETGTNKADEGVKEVTVSLVKEAICNEEEKEENIHDIGEDKMKQKNESELSVKEVLEKIIEKDVEVTTENDCEKPSKKDDGHDSEKTSVDMTENLNNKEVCTKDPTDLTDTMIQTEIEKCDETEQVVKQDIEESKSEVNEVSEVNVKETEKAENETAEDKREIEVNANIEVGDENGKDEVEGKMTVKSGTEEKIVQDKVESANEADDKLEQEKIGSKDEEKCKSTQEKVGSKESEEIISGNEIGKKEPEKVISVEKDGETEEREEGEVICKKDEMQNTEQEKDIGMKPSVKKKVGRKGEEKERKKEKDSQVISLSSKNKLKEIEVSSKSEIKDSKNILDKKPVPPTEEISLKDLSLLTCIKQEPMDVEEDLTAAEEDEDGSLLSSIRTGTMQTRRSELVTTSEDRDHSSPSTLNDKDNVLPSYLYPSVTITVDNDKHVETNGPSEPLHESSTSQMASPQADGTINIEEVKASVGLPRAISLSVIAGNSNTKESNASSAVEACENFSSHDTPERCGAPTIITTPMGYTVTAHNGLEISTHPAPQSLSTLQSESTVPAPTSQGRARKSFPNRPHPQVKITQSMSGGPSGKNFASSGRRGSSDSRRGSFNSLSSNLSQIQGGEDSNSGATSIRNSDGPMVYIPSASARFSGLANGPSALINGDLSGAVHRLGSSHSGGAHHQGIAMAGGSLLPHLQPRPSPQQAAGLLTGKCNGTVPPEAGPVSEDISKHAQKLAGYMQQTIEDVLRDMSNSGNLEASTKMLQLELEKVHWRYQQEIAELKHNTDLLLVEMRAGMMSEQQRAIADAVRQCEIDKQRAIEDTKKKQWCTSCGKEALFYCCWNTSYCDYPCQQRHWPQHMASCGQAESMKAREAAENGLPAGPSPAAALVHHAAKGFPPGPQLLSSTGPPSSKGVSLPGVQTHRPRGPAPPYSLMPMPRPPMQVVGRVQPASSTTTGIAASSNITTTTSTSATTSCVAFVHTPVNSGASPVILCHVSGRPAPPGGSSVVATAAGISRASSGVPSTGSAAGGGGCGGGGARATGKPSGGGGPSLGSSSGSSSSSRTVRATASAGGGATPTSSPAPTPTAALLHLRPVVAAGPVVRLP